MNCWTGRYDLHTVGSWALKNATKIAEVATLGATPFLKASTISLPLVSPSLLFQHTMNSFSGYGLHSTPFSKVSR
jgi:hypothetical protein